MDSHVEHMIGLGAHGTGSSSATHPAAVFGPGGRPAGDAIVAVRVTKGAVEQVYWRYEDQLNSCVGQADENGWRTMQNGYLAFGEAMQSRVLYDGAVSRLSAVEYDGLALTTITLANNDLSTDALNGALLFLARPGYNGNRHMEAAVVDTTANTIVVEDLTGDLFEALGPEGRPITGFVIFAFNDSKQANAPTYQTHGTWTSAPSYASSQTTFTDADADDNGGGFASWMIGSILVPDVNIGAPLIITGATATTLTVAGDARGVAANGSQYIVYAAPFTDPVRGTWQTDPHKGGTRYLWAGYRYQPPQMGFWVDPPGAPALGVYGAATGANRLGQYYCWNRTYDINLGRWTTPDPAAAPWTNLNQYANESPISGADFTGLEWVGEDGVHRSTENWISAETTGWTLGECGAFRWYTAWKLASKASKKGLLFQSIMWIPHIRKCDGSRDEAAESTYHNKGTYQEYWHVSRDSARTGAYGTTEIGGQLRHDDQFTDVSHPNTYGTMMIVARANFIQTDRTFFGDEEWQTIDPNTGDSKTLAAGLPSRKGFLESVELARRLKGTLFVVPTYKVLYVRWDCCKDKRSATTGGWMTYTPASSDPDASPLEHINALVQRVHASR